jgi:hypothetical protein
MTATIIYGDKNTLASSALVEGDNLWLSNVELTRATGWELKPQGACLGDRCVPIPAGRESEFVRPGLFNISALARHLGEPVVHDEQHAIWSFSEAPDEIGIACVRLMPRISPCLTSMANSTRFRITSGRRSY